MYQVTPRVLLCKSLSAKYLCKIFFVCVHHLLIQCFPFISSQSIFLLSDELSFSMYYPLHPFISSRPTSPDYYYVSYNLFYCAILKSSSSSLLHTTVTKKSSTVLFPFLPPSNYYHLHPHQPSEKTKTLEYHLLTKESKRGKINLKVFVLSYIHFTW